MMDRLNLNKREKIFVGAGAVIVFVTLLYVAVVAPYRNQMSGLDKKISLRQKQAVEMVALKEEILELQERLREAETKVSRTVNFSLFSFVEQKVQEAAGKENLVFMRPKPAAQQGDFEETSLEVKLEKISLEQVTRLIYAIEAADVSINIKSLQLRNRMPNAALLDVTMDISTLRRKT